MNTQELIQKYNVAGPRYTSYPTVPHWNSETFKLNDWKSSLTRSVDGSNKISLYIHLPFCESLCTFCACHKRITRNHTLEMPYIEAVLKEWKMYINLLPYETEIEEIHLGGGSPSFFDPLHLKVLIEGITEYLPKAQKHQFSWEANPLNTTAEHLQTLFDLGFKRVSFGVQDYDLAVQRAIKREQSYETVENITLLARQIGYTSVSHDLVFGLPYQTKSSVENTILKTIKLTPERLAFYSYAHVPWLKGNGQRGYDEANLPNGEEKRAFYERGKLLLLEAGYVEIGMDHFALPTDDLAIAQTENTLNRNFMGYTTTINKTLIGLGASAISDNWTMYAQNVKNIEEYQMLVNNGHLPILKGHALNEEELFTRQQILNIMCELQTSWNKYEIRTFTAEKLTGLAQDKLIQLNDNSLKVTDLGRVFLRNICMAFDEKVQSVTTEKVFSMTV